MNGKTSLAREADRRSAGHRLAAQARRSARALVATALVLPLVALVVAGCGGGSKAAETGSGSASAPAGSSSGSDVNAQLARFSQCMRQHGEPDFPDQRTVNGRIQLTLPQGMNPSSAQFQQAMQACRSLAPAQQNGSGSADSAQQDQLVKFVKCMRKNGVPNFPDPTKGGQTVVTGIDPSSPQFQTAMQACQSLIPAGSMVGG
jgi:hypothetical protein